MPALPTRDAERLLRFVAEADSVGGDQPFTPEVLVGLGELVQAQCVTYCELDRVRRRVLRRWSARVTRTTRAQIS